ncbi:MAG: lactate utilization protein [Ignavibacteriales bacterium]|nr:lactate utilization protein [Ignavibacteriales bacterium]
MATVMMNMDDIVTKPREIIFRKKAESVIEKLKKRNINGIYCHTTKEAVAEICRMIPEGASVSLGGSVTIMQSGLLDELRNKKIDLLDRYRPGISSEEVEAVMARGMTADIQLMSCNAVTSDGKLVNEDGRGNRVAGLIFGPKKVIIMVGVNKIVQSVEDGITRIREIAAPLNCIRLGLDTPCARTGFCDDANCLAPARVCSQITIIESNRVKDRLAVVFVGEELGY